MGNLFLCHIVISHTKSKLAQNCKKDYIRIAICFQMTLEHKKIEIIQEIASSTHEELINAVEAVLQNFSKPKFTLDLSKHSNIEQNTNLEKIKIERPPVNFDMDEFIQEANALEWDKSIEELLAELD